MYTWGYRWIQSGGRRSIATHGSELNRAISRMMSSSGESSGPLETSIKK